MGFSQKQHDGIIKKAIATYGISPLHKHYAALFSFGREALSKAKNAHDVYKLMGNKISGTDDVPIGIFFNDTNVEPYRSRLAHILKLLDRNVL
jgi:hypothetical protein